MSMNQSNTKVTNRTEKESVVSWWSDKNSINSLWGLGFTMNSDDDELNPFAPPINSANVINTTNTNGNGNGTTNGMNINVQPK